jgi:hypothetical protein
MSCPAAGSILVYRPLLGISGDPVSVGGAQARLTERTYKKDC